MVFITTFFLSLLMTVMPILLLVNYMFIFAGQLPIIGDFLRDFNIPLLNGDTIFGINSLVQSIKDFSNIFVEHALKLIKETFSFNPLVIELKPYYELITLITNFNSANIIELLQSIGEAMLWPITMLYHAAMWVYHLIAMIFDFFKWFFTLISGAYNTPLHPNTYPCTDNCGLQTIRMLCIITPFSRFLGV